MKTVLGSPYAAGLLAEIGVKDTTAYYEALASQASFSAAFAAQVEKQNLDLLICPAFALPTCPHGTSGDFMQSGSYAYLQNIIDWTAGVVPVTRMDPKGVDAGGDEWYPLWGMHFINRPTTRGTSIDADDIYIYRSRWSKVHNAGDKQTLKPMRKAYEAVVDTGLALPIGVQV